MLQRENACAYVALEVKKQPHQGETPLGVADETLEGSRKALEAAEAAAPFVTKNKDEYARVVSDTRAINLLMQFYNAKTKAAEQVMLFGYDRDVTRLKRAETLLAESVERFRTLADVAGKAYRSAASMETSQRQIPFRGGPKQFPNWKECLPMYEKELATFRLRITQLASGKTETAVRASKLPEVGFSLKAGAGKVFQVRSGEKLFLNG